MFAENIQQKMKLRRIVSDLNKWIKTFNIYFH